MVRAIDAEVLQFARDHAVKSNIPFEDLFKTNSVHSIADINAGICCSKNFENEAMRGGSAWYGG
jgi:hypothetical protein